VRTARLERFADGVFAIAARFFYVAESSPFGGRSPSSTTST
jgi:hypothetical protein